MCKSCMLCASCRWIYVNFVVMHIYLRSQTPRSWRCLSIFRLERAFREINISSTAPASSSSTRLNRPAHFSSFTPRLEGFVLREQKPEDEDGDDDNDNDGESPNRTRRISRGNDIVTREWMNRASLGKPRLKTWIENDWKDWCPVRRRFL